MIRRKCAWRLLVLAAAGLALAACHVVTHNETPLPPGVSAEDMTMGDPAAPVVFIEYAAPTCPHCAHFALDGLPHLKQDYIDKGKVYYVFRLFPLSAEDAAVEAIARCLPREKYFPFMDMMFRDQSEWDPDGYDIPDVYGALVKMAGRAGLSKEKVDACLADPKELERIGQVTKTAIDKYSLSGVPAFVIDGKVVEGYGNWDRLKAEIESKMPKP